MEKELIFEINRKDLLNANTMSGLHYHVKGKIASGLRELAYNEGIKHLTDENRVIVEQRKELMVSEGNNNAFKSKLVKQFKKDNPNLTKKELDEAAYAEIERNGLMLEKKSSGILVEPLFNFFKITVTVYSPTKRRVDSPNFAPTIKHLVDGLTDAGWWSDDSWEYLDEVSFRYGGLSEIKDTFIFKLKIDEIPKPIDFPKH